MKIKETIIHWLGGMTVRESQEQFCNGYDYGKFLTLYRTLDKMHRLNGMGGDEWAAAAYTYVKKEYDKINPSS